MNCLLSTNDTCKTLTGTVVRSTTIPEELGRISYLLTDKTGTLTQNEMVFKKIHLGTVAYGNDSFDEVGQIIQILKSQPLFTFAKNSLKIRYLQPYNR